MDDNTRVAFDTKFVIYDEPPYWQRDLDPPPLKVAWLFHLMDADDLLTLEPDAASLTIEQRERFLRHFAPRANPLASGNIGQTCAEILAPRFGRTVLCGSSKPSAIRRLAELQARLPRAHLEGDPTALRTANVVLAATNAPTPFLPAEVFAPGAIVCDLSVPAAVCPDVRDKRSDLLVIGGGIARLPFGEDHGIVGFPLPPGQVYGCMAETMLLGLEGVRDATFTGMLPAEHVFRLAAMAKRHGVTLAEYKTHATI